MRRFVTLGILLALSVACGSARTIPGPTAYEVQEKLVPSPCIISISVLPPVELEVSPKFDPAFTEKERKAWAAEVKDVEKRNNARYEAAIEARDKQIAKHNGLEPQCEQ